MRPIVVLGAIAMALSPAVAQTFDNLSSYCEAISQMASPALVARTQGLPRSQLEASMAGMTDPLAIRLVKEEIEFAYSRPASRSVDDLRIELKRLCLDKKIFVQ